MVGAHTNTVYGCTCVRRATLSRLLARYDNVGDGKTEKKKRERERERERKKEKERDAKKRVRASIVS